MKTSADGSAARDYEHAPRRFFLEGMRAWQDRFDSRRLADRLEERLGRNRFTVLQLPRADSHNVNNPIADSETNMAQKTPVAGIPSASRERLRRSH
jgi:hypothetical protein